MCVRVHAYPCNIIFMACRIWCRHKTNSFFSLLVRIFNILATDCKITVW